MNILLFYISVLTGALSVALFHARDADATFFMTLACFEMIVFIATKDIYAR